MLDMFSRSKSKKPTTPASSSSASSADTQQTPRFSPEPVLDAGKQPLHISAPQNLSPAKPSKEMSPVIRASLDSVAEHASGASSASASSSPSPAKSSPSPSASPATSRKEKHRSFLFGGGKAKISTVASKSTSSLNSNPNLGEESRATSPLQNAIASSSDLPMDSLNISFNGSIPEPPERGTSKTVVTSNSEPVPPPPSDKLTLETMFNRSTSSVGDAATPTGTPKARSRTSEMILSSSINSSSNSLRDSGNSSGTLKRLSRRPESMISTGTMRLSRKFRDAFGFADDDADAQSMVSFSADHASSHTTDEDELNSDATDDILGISALLIPVQVYVRDEAVPRIFKVNPRNRIDEVVALFVENCCATDVALTEEFKIAPENWRLCKLDKNALFSRVWLSAEETARQCKIKDGDELRLKNVKDSYTLAYAIPPSVERFFLKYGFDDTGKTIVDTIMAERGITSDSKYGLYFRRIGLWLDEKKPLTSFDIEATQILEIRERVQEFLLKIQLPDVNTKFTLKVLPSLTVADIVSMINYNLKTRHISLFTRGLDDPYFEPFNSFRPEVERIISGRKGTVFGLYLASKNSWLLDNKTLEEHGLAKAATEDIQYKIYSHPITVALPAQMLPARDADLINSFSSDGTAIKTNWIQVTCTADMRVQELLDMLANENPMITHHRTAATSWGLFTRGAERIKNELLLWTVLSEASFLEIFDYKMIPKKVSVGSTMDWDVKVELDLDITAPLVSLLPKVCRRFGMTLGEVNALSLVGAKHALDLKKSLLDNGFVESNVLIIDQKPPVPRKDDIKVDDPAGVAMWDEPADSPSNITYASSSDTQMITTATLNKLVEALTASSDSSESTQYLDFLKTFLLTYQSFTTPATLLKKLMERYHVPRQKGSFAEFDKYRLKIQLRTCNVLQQWIKKHRYDFVDTTGNLLGSGNFANPALSEKTAALANKVAFGKHCLLTSVLDFAEGVLVDDHPMIARQLRKFLLRLREGAHGQASAVTHSVAPPLSKFVKPAVVNGEQLAINIFTCDPEEVARQLTLIEFNLFYKIMPYEFLNQAWTKSDAATRTPNIIAITRRFNEIALWVVKSVLEVKTVRSRAKRLTKLVDIAGYLYLQNNFSTLMAFIAGFNKAAVTRLKHTAKELSNKTVKKLIELERIMTAEGSYKNYRSQIHTVNPPCIPYIGVYLLDLTYMEDGNPNSINGLVNFSKRRLINTLIREVQQYQDQPFNLKPVEELVAVLDAAVSMPVRESNPEAIQGTRFPFETVKAYEDHLFELSMQREPRGAERNQVL